MEGTWGALAKELKNQVVVASVDALANRPLAERWGVERFPTIKLVTGGRVYDFEGARTLEDLKAFALEGFSLANPASLPPLASETQQGSPSDASQMHLVIGFVLGMLFAGALWALYLCCSRSPPESQTQAAKSTKSE
ncbi:unnamed protein product [Symbiodinium natans]|uniref:Thioredoxin domain-containing protein n=1 Tax=Symbiodinium natans TaxID=878477 RepID=A0A812S9C6_9DINO|nr:unnamed protein product [Symbiodinium natans]